MFLKYWVFGINVVDYIQDFKIKYKRIKKKILESIIYSLSKYYFVLFLVCVYTYMCFDFGMGNVFFEEIQCEKFESYYLEVNLRIQCFQEQGR